MSGRKQLLSALLVASATRRRRWSCHPKKKKQKKMGIENFLWPWQQFMLHLLRLKLSIFYFKTPRATRSRAATTSFCKSQKLNGTEQQSGNFLWAVPDINSFSLIFWSWTWELKRKSAQDSFLAGTLNEVIFPFWCKVKLIRFIKVCNTFLWTTLDTNARFSISFSEIFYVVKNRRR